MQEREASPLFHPSQWPDSLKDVSHPLARRDFLVETKLVHSAFKLCFPIPAKEQLVRNLPPWQDILQAALPLGILQTDLLFVDTRALDIHENKMFSCCLFELNGFKSRSQSYFKNRCYIEKKRVCTDPSKERLSHFNLATLWWQEEWSKHALEATWGSLLSPFGEALKVRGATGHLGLLV